MAHYLKYRVNDSLLTHTVSIYAFRDACTACKVSNKNPAIVACSIHALKNNTAKIGDLLTCYIGSDDSNDMIYTAQGEVTENECS